MEDISHKGKVVSIDRYVTEVEILSVSACAECHAKGLCGYAEAEKKIVPVPTDVLKGLKVGDEVDLCMKKSMGMKAVWISYVIPLIILMLVLPIMRSLEFSELLSGLSAIGAVAIYYLCLLLFREKLKNDFEFYIKN